MVRTRLYLKQLTKDLPHWAAKGWISPGGEEAILADTREKIRAGNIAPLAFGILGAITLAAGIITFFAANWQEIPKIAKLGILLASLWIAFGAAAFALRREASSLIGQALLLLAALIFGANIQLIGQAYHIGNHYPDGILLWALGALVLTLLVASQPVAVLGLVLTGLWSSTETFGFWGAIHWPFLILWGGFMALAVIRNWKVSRHVGLLVALYWCAISIVGRNFHLSVYLIGLYVPIAMALSVVGCLLEEKGWKAGFGATLRSYAMILGLGAVYALGIRSIEGSALVLGPGIRWIVIYAAAVAVFIALFARQGFRRQDLSRPIMTVGWVVSSVCLAGIAGIFLNRIGVTGAVFLFKALLFAATLWFISRGYELQRRAMVNIGFVFFALGLAALYLDTFWSFMSRSVALMIGGILLLGGGYILERQRRRILAGWSAGS